MTLSRHLSLRINDGQTSRTVENRLVSGLKFTKTAPGGHQGCSFRLNLPRLAGALGAEDRCWIDDARTARTVFGAAYLEQPNPTDGAAGQHYDVQAFGGSVLANDETRALIYIDSALDSWDKDLFAHSESSVEAGIWAGDQVSPRLRLQLPDGTLAATSTFAGAENRSMEAATGMRFGGFAFGVQSGKTALGYAVTLDHPLGSVTLTAALNTTGTGFTLFTGDDFPDGTTYVSLRLVRTGGPTNVADNDTWTDITNISVIGQRMDRFGNLLVGESELLTANTLLASQVVEDLLGRLLRSCDPSTSEITPTTFAIDQLAWPDGTKAGEVLSSLAQFEPDYWWGIHESGDNDRHRLTYQPWPTEPRYVISTADGWSRTGSDTDLCNRIAVTWSDATGKKQALYVTAADLGLTGIGLPVDELEAQGRVKDADPIALPDGRGSAANALQVGSAVLRDKINPPSAGRATVARPILDLYTGGYVQPFEVEPGYLARLRETGETLRLTQVDYDDESMSASLTLGNPVLTIDQRLVRLARASRATLLPV